MKLKLILIGILLLPSVPLSGQIVYPLTVFVVWDKPLIADQVIDFSVVHNNGVGNQAYVILSTACGVDCRQAISINGAVPQTVTVTARNQWGTSLPETVTFSVTAPGKARNIKISQK